MFLKIRHRNLFKAYLNLDNHLVDNQGLNLHTEDPGHLPIDNVTDHFMITIRKTKVAGMIVEETKDKI